MMIATPYFAFARYGSLRTSDTNIHFIPFCLFAHLNINNRSDLTSDPGDPGGTAHVLVMLFPFCRGPECSPSLPFIKGVPKKTLHKELES